MYRFNTKGNTQGLMGYDVRSLKLHCRILKSGADCDFFKIIKTSLKITSIKSSCVKSSDQNYYSNASFLFLFFFFAKLYEFV